MTVIEDREIKELIKLMEKINNKITSNIKELKEVNKQYESFKKELETSMNKLNKTLKSNVC